MSGSNAEYKYFGPKLKVCMCTFTKIIILLPVAGHPSVDWALSNCEYVHVPSEMISYFKPAIRASYSV